MDGKGQAKAGSGAFTLPVTFPSRIGDAGGPDESRRAGCRGARFVLCDGAERDGGPARAGRSPRRNVTATVIADKGDAGIKLTTSKLKVVAEGLQGIEKSQFAEVAKEAESKCPISNALRGSLQIELEAEAR